jgi:hypothetical protein
MKFHELKVGDKFILDNIEHERITDERISCCKVLNAIRKDNQEKVQIVPITEVNLVTNS